MNRVKSKYLKGKEKFAIGIDLGGTNIKIALVSRAGAIRNYLKIPTNTQQGKEATITRIKQGIYQIISQSNLETRSISGIGIGAPGPLDFQKGIIHFAPNLPGWEEVPLAEIIKEEFKIAVKVENDANVAAWGEKTFGIAHGVDELVCLTLGTGIGGGLIFGGKIYHGKNNVAGEAGHIIVNKDGPLCNCGNFGCLEAYSSATGIKNRVSRRIKELEISDPSIFYQNNSNQISLVKIFEQAREGNPIVKDIVEEAIEYLGIGITTLVNLLNPEMVVLVGGITNEGDKLLNPIKDIVFHRAMRYHLTDLKIVFGMLGEYAGVAGAAALLWDFG
jgi:glucokinase